MTIDKISDLKRIDPKEKTQNKHKKKIYPLHWKILDIGIYPSKTLKTSTSWHYTPSKCGWYLCNVFSDEYQLTKSFLKNNELDKALEIYTKYHPETKDWPVRFINIQPMETKREVIK